MTGYQQSIACLTRLSYQRGPAPIYWSNFPHASYTLAFLLSFSLWTGIIAGAQSVQTPGSGLQTSAAVSNTTTQPDGTPLELCKQAETLKDGAQAYCVSLRPGQFLHVDVDQQGLDVMATLYGPGGDKLLSVNILGVQGPEPVSYEAAKAGVHRLEIRPVNDAVAASGSFHLKAAVKPSASSLDKDRLAAERLLVEANELEQAGAKNCWARAKEKREQSLLLWRKLEDKYWEAYTVNNVGVALYQMGDLQAALERYTEALALRKAAGDDNGEANTLNNLGNVYHKLGDNRNALAFYNRSLILRKSTGDASGEAATLNNMGQVYDLLGEKQKALLFYKLALPIRQSLKDVRGQVDTLNSIGALYASLGDATKAMDFYTQALTLVKLVRNRGGEAVTLNNIGNFYNDSNEKQKAVSFYNQALEIYKSLDDKSGLAIALNNLADVYSDLDDKQRALDLYGQALELKKSAGDTRSEAITLLGIGRVYQSQGEQQKAVETFNRALTLFHEAKALTGEGLAESYLMKLWKDAGKTDLAINYGKKAVDVYQEIRSNLKYLDRELKRSYVKSIEDTYRVLADLLTSQGRLEEARQVLDMLKAEEYFDFIRRSANDTRSLNLSASLDQRERDENLDNARV
jgi:tetratricopeptide (TPR) repeat protein